MEAIIVIAAAAALVWAIVFTARIPLALACLLYLIAGCCFGKYFYAIDAAIPISLDRLLLVLVAGTFVVRRALRRYEPKPLDRADYVLLAFVGWLVLQTLLIDWSHKPPGKDNITPLWHLLVGYLIPFSLYWIARQSTLDDRGVSAVHWGLAGFGVYLAITGILEGIGASALVFPRYIADPDVGIHFGRARGPMVQSARFGTYLNICFAAAFVGLYWRGRWGRPGVLLLMLLTPLFLAASAFTYTRSVWMGSGLILLVLLALLLRGAWRPLTLGALVLVALAAVAVKRDDLIAFEREKSAAVTRESTYMRASFAYVSWKMFQDQPIFGRGFSQFPLDSKYYLSDRDVDLKLEALRGYIHHNTYLSILVDTGLIGLVLFLLVLGGSIYQAWRLWRDPDAPDWARGHALLHMAAMAVYLVQLMSREVSYTPIENGVICLLAGITIGTRMKLAGQRDKLHDATHHAAEGWTGMRSGLPATSFPRT
ncbi:MAG: hypothetical protein DWQ31_11525 [Planctomycetota bacterium]|nr:MAG: hypothetical protein DWQ31_11525 [Planctomycetota bacterium]REK22886.1 MAG: hypothetical protein DWQ42_16380 [Planctomycetota bacterium]REK37414.1 MAG: hypothetical protein DWQ46_22295 [Planctomycetota bacterium]